MAQLIFNPTNGLWINLEKPGGRVYFVAATDATYPSAAKGKGGSGIGASDSNDGLTPERPFATIDGTSGAHNHCTSGRGDTIALLPGNVTITAAMAFDLDDITLSGIDPNGALNPSQITVNAGIDGIAVTGANVVIENLHFVASTTTNATSRINCGAAGLTIRNNTFECGTYDLETITIPSAGHYTNIVGNNFYITADGPDAAIEIEAASIYGIVIKDNVFFGRSSAAKWDTGAINSGFAHLDCWIKGNTFTDGEAILFTAAATGMIADNDMGSGTLGSMLDPGSCMCVRNFEADAIDQKAREFPTTAAS
jgi:hypothetical protein